MPPKPIGNEELSAYFVAGQAVAATHYGIQVRRVSIKADRVGYARAQLATLRESCNLKAAHTPQTIARIEKYVTTLLSGQVGRLIRTERSCGYSSRCTGQVRLQSAYLSKILKCSYPEAELAFVLTIGWLASVDEGNPVTTLERLWKQANRLLRKEENRRRLDRLAGRLKITGELCGREVENLIG